MDLDRYKWYLPQGIEIYKHFLAEVHQIEAKNSLPVNEEDIYNYLLQSWDMHHKKLITSAAMPAETHPASLPTTKKTNLSSNDFGYAQSTSKKSLFQKINQQQLVYSLQQLDTVQIRIPKIYFQLKPKSMQHKCELEDPTLVNNLLATDQFERIGYAPHKGKLGSYRVN